MLLSKLCSSSETTYELRIYPENPRLQEKTQLVANVFFLHQGFRHLGSLLMQSTRFRPLQLLARSSRVRKGHEYSANVTRLRLRST